MLCALAIGPFSKTVADAARDVELPLKRLRDLV